MNKEGKKNLLSGILAIAFSIFLFMGAKNIPNRQKLTVSSAMFPRVVAVLFLLVGIPLTIQGIIQLIKSRADNDTSSLKESIHSLFSRESIKKLEKPLFTFLLVVIFVMMLKPFGVMVSGTVYLFLTFLLLIPKEKRNWFLIVVVAVAVPVFIFFLFTKAFHMTLPTGTIIRRIFG